MKQLRRLSFMWETDLEHVGTFQMADGDFIGHLFEVE